MIKRITFLSLSISIILIVYISLWLYIQNFSIWLTFSVFLISFFVGILEIPFSLAFTFFVISLFIFNFVSFIISWIDFKTLPFTWNGSVSLNSLNLILISLAAFVITYFSLKVFSSNPMSSKNFENLNLPKKYFRILFYIVLFSYISKIIFNFIAIIIVLKFGYLSYWLNFMSFYTQRAFFVRITELGPIFFFFLIPFSKKGTKSRKILVFLYFFEAFTNLFIGKRGSFILNLMIFILFLAYEAKKNGFKSVKSFRKKFFIVTLFVLIMAPLFLASMKLIEIIRVKENLYVRNYNLIELSKEVLFSQGISGLVLIDFVVDNKDELPKNKSFLLAPLYEYFSNSIFSKAFGKTQEYNKFSRDFAFNSGYLSSLFAYLNVREYYLSGGGTGSSYIAEAYGDAGILGVIFVNVLYAIICYIIDIKIYLTPLKLTILLNIMRYILWAPRAMAFYFIKILIQPSFIISFFFLYLILYRSKEKIPYSKKIKHKP